VTCPHTDSVVLETRGDDRRRRRKCSACLLAFTTYEVESARLLQLEAKEKQLDRLKSILRDQT